jgi:hypothetical protein
MSIEIGSHFAWHFSSPQIGRIREHNVKHRALNLHRAIENPEGSGQSHYSRFKLTPYNAEIPYHTKPDILDQ